MAKQTLRKAANQLVPTKPLSKTRAMSRAIPQGQAGYDSPREPITDNSTIKVLNSIEINAKNLKVGQSEVLVNTEQNTCDFKVSTSTTAGAIHVVDASDSILLGTTQIGFYGHAAMPQPAAIGDASGGAVVDIEARTAINALLAACRNSGFISP
jgi:hypothetical protein|tara:strand:+ start:2082 stop:2543 length:462 start_codon:yes stop_codon:yes gene_type:complete